MGGKGGVKFLYVQLGVGWWLLFWGGMNGVKFLYVELESDGLEVFIMIYIFSCYNFSFEY